MSIFEDSKYELIEKTISEETIYEGKVFTCKHKKVLLPDGSEGARDIVIHNGGACILAIDDENNAYMVRQFRSPFEQTVFEVPAGKLEKGEDPYVCAKRELREETGFEASEIIELGRAYASPGYTSEIIYLYAARGLKFVGTHLDEDEYLCVEKVPFDDLIKAVDDGTIVDGKSIACIYKASRRLGLGKV